MTANTAPPLPAPFTRTLPPPELLALGAEAHIYRTHFLNPSHSCVLKYRPPKAYRHPILDLRLTRHRILSEARTLVKCRREGVSVPAVLALDAEGGWMMEEWIEGGTVRERLQERRKREVEGRQKQGVDEDVENEASTEVLKPLLEKIGQAVGRMHEIGVVHGDLTTSNLMLRLTESHPNGDASEDGADASLDGEIVLIDFGLAGQSVQDEDKAVDLYVLERAFGSTHPELEDHFQEVLHAYGESYKGAIVVLKRLVDVRMRGRKKSMIG